MTIVVEGGEIGIGVGIDFSFCVAETETYPDPKLQLPGSPGREDVPSCRKRPPDPASGQNYLAAGFSVFGFLAAAIPATEIDDAVFVPFASV